MPPVYLARLYRNEDSTHIADIPLAVDDAEAAAEAAKETLAAHFHGQPINRLKPTFVILAEALPRGERHYLRRFYLFPDGHFEERPVEWENFGKATRVEQY